MTQMRRTARSTEAAAGSQGQPRPRPRPGIVSLERLRSRLTVSAARDYMVPSDWTRRYVVHSPRRTRGAPRHAAPRRRLSQRGIEHRVTRPCAPINRPPPWWCLPAVSRPPCLLARFAFPSAEYTINCRRKTLCAALPYMIRRSIREPRGGRDGTSTPCALKMTHTHIHTRGRDGRRPIRLDTHTHTHEEARTIAQGYRQGSAH